MRSLRHRLLLAAASFALAGRASSASFDLAATAGNELGLGLYRQVAARPGNLCLSPYCISSALAMTRSGAEGETRAEMSRVMHVSADADLDASFAALQLAFKDSAAKTAKIVQDASKFGGPSEPITLSVANRLFPQTGLGYGKRHGYVAVALPYLGSELQFVILLPDAPAGLPQPLARPTARRR